MMVWDGLLIVWHEMIFGASEYEGEMGEKANFNFNRPGESSILEQKNIPLFPINYKFKNPTVPSDFAFKA